MHALLRNHRFRRPVSRLGGTALSAALALVATAAWADNFSAIDSDTSDDISAEEYYEHVRETGLYNRWDRNDDGLLDEFESVDDYDYDRIGWDLDGDGNVNDTEFYQGVFDYYDRDGSDRWDRTEWEEVRDAGPGD